MRILITNITLTGRTGTELYVRDLARRLLELGHEPAIYAPTIGPIAHELRSLGIAVFTDFRTNAFVPEVIHGHHTHQTMTAIARFAHAPALFMLHDWEIWHDCPPHHPRILRYLAVDHTCYDRLVFEHGVDQDVASVLYNFVDMRRFARRGPLPARPKRALIFSNYANASTHLHPAIEACRQRGIAVDVMGSGVGKSHDAPEQVVGDYDLVFAKAKCALEALATGAAVVLCDQGGVGDLVSPSNFDELRRLNFGRRALACPVRVDALLAAIDRYDAEAAASVTDRVRREADLLPAVDTLVALYRTMISEHQTRPASQHADAAALASYLAACSPDATVDDWQSKLAASRYVD